MHTILKCLILLITVFQTCYGIQCRLCSSYASNEDCNSRSILQKCRTGQVCENSYRKIGTRKLITKRCAPRSSCSNRCFSKGATGLCKQCCTSDNCNGAMLTSEPKISGGSTRGSSTGSACEGLYVRYGSTRCVRLKLGNSVGTTCIFWCRHDYVRKGPSRLTCVRSNGGVTWSGAPPICVPKGSAQQHENPGSCPALEYDTGTTYMECSNEFHFKSACTFTCKDGYAMFVKETGSAIKSGERRLVCWRGVAQPVVWTKSVPQCLEKRCPMLIRKPYSTSYCDDWVRVGSVCDISCMPGYKRVGAQYIGCFDDGGRTDTASWNDTVPACEPRECPVDEIPFEILSATCTDRYFFTSQCRFRCNLGYYMISGRATLYVNAASSTCSVSNDDDMFWRPQTPQCVLKTCLDASEIENGETVCTDENRYLSTCSYSCYEGFLLTGAQNRTCIDKGINNSRMGTWDTPKPWCRPKLCDPMVYYDAVLQMSCTDGDKFGSVCTFTCGPGHFMTTADGLEYIESGMSTTECIISRRTVIWSNIAPMCHKKTCDELAAPATGRMTCTDENNHNSVCSFSCNIGYALSGKESIICEDTGTIIPKQTWSDDPPLCEPKPCPPVEYDSRTTTVECSNSVLFLSTCMFKCRVGYYMTSSKSGNIISLAFTVCGLNAQSELQWTEIAPTCLLKSCSELSPPTNGMVKCTEETDYGSVCKFSCLPGYETRREDELRCEDDGFNKPEGRWSNESPTCEPRSCDNFNIDMDSTGFICESNFEFLSTCEFHCLEGHYMTSPVDSTIVDSAFATCGVRLQRMVWSEKPPKCRLKGCDPLPKYERGIFRCSKGRDHDSTCSLICVPGFYVSGTPSVRCEDNGINDPKGQWDDQPPTCERRSCEKQEMEFPDRLSEECSESYAFESICNYTCTRGHYLSTLNGVERINKAQVKCGVRGRDMTWSSPLPTCSVITCPIRENPENGNVTCTQTNEYSSVCTYTCHRGYVMEGVDSINCAERGHNNPIGQWSDEPPVCEPRSCPPLPIDKKILHKVCDRGDKYKSLCEFSCNVGYYTKSEDGTDFLATATSECLVDEDDNMVWSDNPPMCHIKMCELHGTFIEGNIVCTNGTFFESECQFSCNPGFRLAGEDTSTCMDTDRTVMNANWSTELPVCEARSCPELEYDKLISTTNCTEEDKYRSMCSFGCVSGYYMTRREKVVDEATTTCDVRGDTMHWTAKAPVCMLKSCETARTPKDGRVECTDENKYASNCTYTCSIVHFVNGAEMITCEADDRNVPEGVWSEPFPTCELRSCPDWEYDSRAIAETCSNEYKYGSSCFFSCKEGFYLPPQSEEPAVGFSTATCSIEGTVMTWIGGPPVCEIKTCTPLSYPENGAYTCTNDTDYDTLCTFTCERGHLLIGKKVIRCEDDGSNKPTGIWAAEEPICEPRSCKTLNYDRVTQTVECSFGKKYGSVCQIKCIEGYYMTARDGVTLLDFASTTCDVNPRNNRAVLWAGDKPRCFMKSCIELTPPVDGSFKCNGGTDFGSRCIFDCLPGFKVTGNLTTSCKDDGRNVPTGVWNRTPPKCEPKSCPRLVNNVNTTRVTCSDGWKYRSLCTFSCNKGFFVTGGEGESVVKVGKATTKCGRGTGTGMAWSNDLPNCLSKFCLALRSQKNMTMTCSDGFRFKSMCKFACDPPLQLKGPAALTCLDDAKSDFSGKWDGRFWGLGCRP